MSEPARAPVNLGADLYNDIQPEPVANWRDYGPGLTVAIAATMAAGFMSERYGAPLTLMALLVGLSLNFLGADDRLSPGLRLASRELLRAGIVLVGARVTFGQIANLGAESLLAVITILVATSMTGVVAARLLGLDKAFGVLAGGSVAICGASAAMALAATLGERRIGQPQLAIVLVGVSAASSAGMFLYPLLAHALGLSDRQAGFVLGASIHDVAQALGAGYSFSDEAGQVATIVKLARVAMLAPALAVVALCFKTNGRHRAAAFVPPWFVTGFFLLAAVNSVSCIPSSIERYAASAAGALLACAVTAAGIHAPMKSLLVTGTRPLAVVLAATVAALLFSLLVATQFS